MNLSSARSAVFERLSLVSVSNAPLEMTKLNRTPSTFGYQCPNSLEPSMEIDPVTPEFG